MVVCLWCIKYIWHIWLQTSICQLRHLLTYLFLFTSPSVLLRWVENFGSGRFWYTFPVFVLCSNTNPYLECVACSLDWLLPTTYQILTLLQMWRFGHSLLYFSCTGWQLMFCNTNNTDLTIFIALLVVGYSSTLSNACGSEKKIRRIHRQSSSTSSFSRYGHLWRNHAWLYCS